MTHRITAKFKSFVRRLIMPKLCSDCKPKIGKMIGVHTTHKHHRIKHRRKHHRKAHRQHASKHKLRPGVHSVRIRGKLRKVRVLSNGRWRFMKA